MAKARCAGQLSAVRPRHIPACETLARSPVALFHVHSCVGVDVAHVRISSGACDALPHAVMHVVGVETGC